MKILVVDDSFTARLMLIKILAEFGYNDIKQCADVDEAKIILRQNEISLIFADWHMQNATGLDLLQYVRGNFEYINIPFILVTSEQDKSCILKAAKLGLQSYVVKPPQKDTLKSKLAELASKFAFPPPV